MQLNPVGIGTGNTKNLTVDLLHAAFDLGMNVVDTAANYGTEEIIGKAMAGRRDKVFVATKLGPEALREEDVIASCDMSLVALETDYVDLLQVHWLNPAIPIESTIEGFQHLLKQGKVVNVGLCNVTLPQLMKWVELLPEIYSVQNEYNLFDRSVEDRMLSYCFKHNIKLFAYSPLDQGHFCGGPKKAEFLKPLASKYNTNVAAFCLGYLLSMPGVYVLPRISSVSRLTEIGESETIIQCPGFYDVYARLTVYDNIYRPIKILPSELDLVLSPYKTSADAVHNYLSRCPHPLDLARDGTWLKPLKAWRRGTIYELCEGFMRYWAHVIANGDDPVEVLVRE